jgi:hypothetical protein
VSYCDVAVSARWWSSSNSVTLAFSDDENARLEAAWQLLPEQVRERAWRKRVRSDEQKDKKKKKGKEKDEEKSGDDAAAREGEIESDRQQEVKCEKRGESGVTDPGERVGLNRSSRT